MRKKIATICTVIGLFMILGGVGACEVGNTSFLQMAVTCTAGVVVTYIGRKLSGIGA